MILLDGSSLALADLVAVADGAAPIALAPSARAQVARSRAVVDRLAGGAAAVYGVNTGFGNFAETRISHDDLARLQTNLIRSHATGVDAPLPPRTVRAMMALRANVLAKGFSGIRPATLEALLALLQHGVHPYVPSRGSVGASGDLAPLAHLALVLIGEGETWDGQHRGDGAAALRAARLAPVVLGPKEGLALINGTQVSTALALQGLFAAENIFSAALVSGAMTTDAILGSDTPFDPRIHAVRGHRGQADAAAALKSLMNGSQIRHSHEDCDRVQDPYSIRCQPQVMGACLEALRHAAGILEIEANAVSDNPLVFADTGEILSGGNFHAEPVALAADHLALAMAEIGALAERRIALLIDRSLSNLPAFLVQNGGLNSGFMIAHVTAAALASENKSLAHPASVDSLPTSANQEDHVSMATFAARRLSDMHANTSGIIGIELLAAAQGIDFRRPLKSSPTLENELAAIRADVPFYAEDRFFAPDIAAARALVDSGRYRAAVDGHIHLPSGT